MHERKYEEMRITYEEELQILGGKYAEELSKKTGIDVGFDASNGYSIISLEMPCEVGDTYSTYQRELFYSIISEKNNKKYAKLKNLTGRIIACIFAQDSEYGDSFYDYLNYDNLGHIEIHDMLWTEEDFSALDI